MSLAVQPSYTGQSRRRMTLVEWHRAGEVGLFGDDERLELRHGEVVRMSPIGSRHAARVAMLHELFRARLGPEVVTLFSQSPLVLLDDTEPIPDFTILKHRGDWYEGALPTAADALLVIEVADSSLTDDLTDKARDYAASGVPEYWVVDLVSREVVVHTDPRANGAWGTVRRIGRGGLLTPIKFPELSVPCELLAGKE